MITALLLLGAALALALVILARQRRALEQYRREQRALRENVAELERSMVRFREAAEALPDGVVILDQHRRIEWINPQASHCLDISPDCDIGTIITHLLREPDFVALMDVAIPGSSLELRTRRYPSHVLHVQVVPFERGRILLMVRDVTQLDRLATMRRDFVANVSHELKTPLTVTLGFIETAQDALADASPHEIAGYLQTAADQAQRMRRLIDDLLTLSGLENDAPPPLEEVVALPEMIAEVRDEAVALSAGRHVIEMDVVTAPTFRGSSRELHSAMTNLASNAVRYTPEGGRIRLEWHEMPDGGGEFCVIDSGLGIAPEHIGRLTERFYRVDRGRSRDVGGTGLGLAIVKHVLERHGASLRINSQVGKGSSFCAAFPATRVVR